MIISLKWLNQYIDIGMDGDKIAQDLIAIGHEVEKIEKQGTGFDCVVIGQVIKKEVHPESEKLSLCVVDVGTQHLQIVCGAPNHQAGDKVVVATVGAVLPGDFAIKKSKIRGIESCGMLCSEKELGFSEEQEGIMILPQEAVVGSSAAHYFHLDDVLLHLEITPNRGDCLSYCGIARELSALYSISLKTVEHKNIEIPLTQEIPLHHEDATFYLGAKLSGVKVTASPEWLKSRLEAIGLKSINNLVDISNYILFETGYPIHFFDADKIEGNIQVRRSRVGEKLFLLDGKEREITENSIVIADDKKGLALAGIMGAKCCEVSETTQNIWVEIAHFNGDKIRQTAKSLAISSDASYRFERGVDGTQAEAIFCRVLTLLESVTPLTLESVGKSGHYHRERVIIPLHLDRLYKNLGIEIDDHQVVHILNQLRFIVERVTPKSFKVTPPSYRMDVTLEADLYEEVARYFGYNAIPAQTPSQALQQGKMGETLLRSEEMRDFLASAGLYEAINFSFIPKNALEKISFELEEERRIHLLNPLSDDMVLMRPTLLYSLLKNGSDHLKRGIKAVNLFEVSKVFEQSQEGSQESLVGGIVLGGVHERSIWQSESSYDFFDLKGIIESLLEFKGVNVQWVRSRSAHMHPGVSADMMIGRDCVGTLGQIHPEVLANFDIETPLFVAEFYIDKLYKYGKKRSTIEEISKYPSVERDLALLVDREILVSEMLREAEKLSPYVKKVELFDVYQGDKIASNLKSVAFNLQFSSTEKTLTDTEVNGLMQQLLTKLTKRFNAALREG